VLPVAPLTVLVDLSGRTVEVLPVEDDVNVESTIVAPVDEGPEETVPLDVVLLPEAITPELPVETGEESCVVLVPTAGLVFDVGCDAPPAVATLVEGDDVVVI
jgi:hypothetical protein